MTFAPPKCHDPAGARSELLDLLLADDIADALANDRRTEHLELSLSVRGAVAHIEGEVSDQAELALVRTLAGRVAGIHAVWDLVRVADESRLTVVDVGCGGTKQVTSAIGIDAFPHPEVDLLADLDDGLPLDTASVDRLFAVHVLEHVRDMLAVMRELHRVLRPSGVLHVLAPSWRHVNAVADPTHLRYLDVQTFRYFCSRRPGVEPWRPLMASASDSTIHADLQPLAPEDPLPSPAELARWFA